MPKINQALLDRLQKKLGVKQRQLYGLIQRKVAETHLERH